MKTILIRSSLLLAALTIFAATLSAQKRRHHPPRPFHFLEQHQEELGLTDTQRAELEALKANFTEEASALREQAMEPGEKRAAMRDLLKTLKAELESILTAEQMEQLESMRQAAQTRAKKAFSAVKAYMAQNVYPVMLEQRKKLEAEISPQDQEELQRLREAIAQHKAERKAAWEAAKAKGERLPRPKKGEHTKREAVEAMVDKYDAEIEALFAEVADQAEQWKADIKFILEAHRPEDAPKVHRRPAKRRGDDVPRLRLLRKARFLLMDPSEKSPEEPKAIVQSAKAFPNPASNLLNLQYELRESAEVDIQIHTKEGQLQQTLNQGRLQAGAQQARLDVSQLRDGAYYISILANDEVQVTPFIIAKQ